MLYETIDFIHQLLFVILSGLEQPIDVHGGNTTHADP